MDKGGDDVDHSEVSVEPRQIISVGNRLFRWLDSGLTQTLIGIVGGLAGTFLDGRYYIILALFVPAAIHQKKVLEDVRKASSIAIYCVSTLICFGVLYWCGVSLNRSHSNTYSPKDWANAMANILFRDQPTKNKIAPNPNPLRKHEVLNPNDVKISICRTELSLKTVVRISDRFDGPQTCRLLISNMSKIMLKNTLLQIHVSSRNIKITTAPPATIVPGGITGSIDDESYQIPIIQTIVKGGVPFPVIVGLPHSSKRYEMQIQILKDDGQSLGWWGIDIIPLHESD
jgi:hypothetical protein